MSLFQIYLRSVSFFGLGAVLMFGSRARWCRRFERTGAGLICILGAKRCTFDRPGCRSGRFLLFFIWFLAAISDLSNKWVAVTFFFFNFLTLVGNVVHLFELFFKIANSVFKFFIVFLQCFYFLKLINEITRVSAQSKVSKKMKSDAAWPSSIQERTFSKPSALFLLPWFQVHGKEVEVRKHDSMQSRSVSLFRPDLQVRDVNFKQFSENASSSCLETDVAQSRE